MDKKKSSMQLARAVMSAVHNASIGLKKEKDMLEFHGIQVNQGRSLKRYRPGSRGMAKPIKRETCHITIELKIKK
jgi:large subunit ribosomal protein L22